MSTEPKRRRRPGDRYISDSPLEPVAVGGKGQPPMPSDLTPKQETLWRSMAPQFEAAGVLHRGDAALLRSLVVTTALVELAADTVAVDGIVTETSTGTSRPSGALRAFEAMVSRQSQLLAIFERRARAAAGEPVNHSAAFVARAARPPMPPQMQPAWTPENGGYELPQWVESLQSWMPGRWMPPVTADGEVMS